MRLVNLARTHGNFSQLYRSIPFLEIVYIYEKQHVIAYRTLGIDFA